MPIAPTLMRLSQTAFNQMRSRKAWTAADAEAEGDLDSLRKGKYCLVVTYKRNGEAVPTPVWFGLAHGRVYFRSLVHNGKTKRIRNNGRVLIAACDSRGRPTAPPLPATARIMSPDEEASAEAVIASNYRLARKLYNAVAAGRVDGVYIEVTPAGH